MTTKWIKRKRSRIIRGVIFVIALAVFLFSSWKLFTIFREYKQGSDEYDNLAEEALKILSEADKDETEEVKQDSPDIQEEEVRPWEDLYQVMHRENEDYVGWIVIDDTKINYPIVQTMDNDYYLTHTFGGETNASGSLFVDCRIPAGMEGKHVIVYGHNMKDGSMLAGLKKYLDDEFYEQHKTFRVYTATGLYTYEIFAVREISPDNEAYTLEFTDDTDFMSYIKKMQSDSVQSTGVLVSAEDKILTLSTCINQNRDRLVVQAKRLES